ncbi:MAG: hypothetical protein ACYDAG_07360 [Chloroflexota bacterium]
MVHVGAYLSCPPPMLLRLGSHGPAGPAAAVPVGVWTWHPFRRAMWVEVLLVALRFLARLAIRLSPFLGIMALGLFRRYRWRVYDLGQRYHPRGFSAHRLRNGMLTAAALALGLVVLLFLLVTHLSPGRPAVGGPL